MDIYNQFFFKYLPLFLLQQASLNFALFWRFLEQFARGREHVWSQILAKDQKVTFGNICQRPPPTFGFGFKHRQIIDHKVAKVSKIIPADFIGKKGFIISIWQRFGNWKSKSSTLT